MFKTLFSFCILIAASVLLAASPAREPLQERFDKLAGRKTFGEAEAAELRAIHEEWEKNPVGIDCSFCPDALTWYLVEHGFLAEANWLFTQKADFGIRNRDGMTLLHLACRKGYQEFAKLLVEGYGAEIDLSDNEGRTAIHYAAMSGNSDLVHSLLDYGCDPNKLTARKDTPLHFAAKYAGLEEVEFLVEHGGSIKAINWTLVENLKEQRRRQDKIYYDSDEEHIAALKDALGLNTPESLERNDEDDEDDEDAEDDGGERYADATAEKSSGKNPRQNRTLSRIDMERIPFDLLPRDVNDAANSDGITALHCAAENGDVAVVKFLIEHGADIKAQDTLLSRSVIHFAAENGNIESIRFLAEKGADLLDKDLHGATPLHYAAKGGHLDTVKYLVGKKMDYTARDVRGWTLMHYAACGGSIDVVKYLLAKGVSINDLTDSGRTPLFFAKDRELRKFMISMGAK